MLYLYNANNVILGSDIETLWQFNILLLSILIPFCLNESVRFTVIISVVDSARWTGLSQSVAVILLSVSDWNIMYAYVLLKIIGNYTSNVQINFISCDLLRS